MIHTGILVFLKAEVLSFWKGTKVTTDLNSAGIGHLLLPEPGTVSHHLTPAPVWDPGEHPRTSSISFPQEPVGNGGSQAHPAQLHQYQQLHKVPSDSNTVVRLGPWVAPHTSQCPAEKPNTYPSPSASLLCFSGGIPALETAS